MARVRFGRKSAKKTSKAPVILGILRKSDQVDLVGLFVGYRRVKKEAHMILVV